MITFLKLIGRSWEHNMSNVGDIIVVTKFMNSITLMIKT